LLKRLTLQYLVHSFLYYQLGETLISDQQYDQLCQELNQQLSSAPESEETPYRKLVEQALGPEASGYTLRQYPEPVVSAALHLLHQAQAPERSFAQFCERLGYRLDLA
jgi:NAD-dependent DNA ligase